MRLRLWARIGLTLAVNFALLVALGAVFVAQQNRGGLESLLYASARERIRDLGSRVAAEFPGEPESERNAFLEELQKPYGVVLAVYKDTGELVAGPDLKAPEDVMREIRRARLGRGPEDRPPKGGSPLRRGDVSPMFLVKENSPARYWAGFHFPIVEREGNPPVRHTVVVITHSLLGSPLFVDWKPWRLGVSLALLVTVACWVPLIRRLTRSIDLMRRAAGEIAEGNFEVKVPARGGDELGELGASIGRMAQQLSRLVHGQRRFLADVAHELCAPLSRIQLSAGILDERLGPGEADYVRRLERDVSHMSALVGDLLAFTKGAARKPELSRVRLSELVRDIVNREHGDGVTVQVEVDDTATVLADREYLDRAVGNVVRNAILYAGHAGPIRIYCERDASLVRLMIDDSGPGLPEDELEAVFTPFYRPDAVRTPGTGGVGLGLAIVKGSVEACGGSVRCRNRKPVGLEVVVELRSG